MMNPKTKYVTDSFVKHYCLKRFQQVQNKRGKDQSVTPFKH